MKNINLKPEKPIQESTFKEECSQRKRDADNNKEGQENEKSENEIVTHKGKLITDATACPQNTAYPTDLNLLNDAREKAEELIDTLYDSKLHQKKPRTYREVARKRYLKTAQKKVKPKKEIRKAVKKQLAFLGRNLKGINKLLDSYQSILLRRHDCKYLLVINTLYDQQMQMFMGKQKKIRATLTIDIWILYFCKNI